MKIENCKLKILLFLAFPALAFLSPLNVSAAILSVSPSGGTFIVGSTFDVSVLVNTEGEAINTILATLNFPPDKLQIVSPSSGRSVIGVWLGSPSYDNQNGLLNFQGGIPSPGLNTSNGLVATVTFRVKSVGRALVQFLDDSKVLLNDGRGTDALTNTANGIYQLVLPPPAGPIIVSETHPDQTVWYNNPTVLLKWTNNYPVIGYSYILNDEPMDNPDNISEGARTEVVFKDAGDGTHYFHIKALGGENQWGATSHFAVNADSTPPADFKINILPSARTTSQSPFINFSTTDAYSGINHYELNIVALGAGQEQIGEGKQNFFVEASSPYYFDNLARGKYDIIVRAYDNAGNFKEVTERLNVVGPFFQIIEDKGVRIGDFFTILWLYIFIAGFLLVLVLGYLVFHFWRWHHMIDRRRAQKVLPDEVQSKLSELKELRDRYGKNLLILFIIGFSLWGSITFAQQEVEVSPPIVTTVSRNISNQEIFYIGGKTDVSGAKIIIYLQNLQTGATTNHAVTSDTKGDWFYTHSKFLQSGNYLLWVQSQFGEQLSPPSSQIQITVAPTALQFGASRVSYQSLYFFIALALFAVILALLGLMMYHYSSGKRKNQRLLKEITEAEAAVRRGFAVLRRDIEAELSVIHKIKLSKEISAEEKIRERQLLEDLEKISNYIGKEVWDIEREF